MRQRPLQDRCILVVEDEYLLARDICAALSDAGAQVMGPAASISAARALLNSGSKIDGAVLDINLRGELVFTIADALHQRGVPIAFATGYDGSVVPERFADALRMEKPIEAGQIATVLARSWYAG